VIDNSEVDKVDSRLSKYIQEAPGLQDGKIIDLTKWSLDEMNSPIYPETRVFKKVCKIFCGTGINEENLSFLEYEYPFSKQKYLRFYCKDLGE
jgi:hypothetical protein